MARVKAPPQLPELVKTAFANALRDDALHFFPTQATLVTVNSTPFQLRFSPSLANKPKGPPREPSSKPFDPFDDPPAPLRIADLEPAHVLVLNKFAVVPEHFILATRAFKPQTHLLEADDLAATQACIAAYHDRGQELFAFFNCGQHSGASQPHRHIQLLPVERMRDGLEQGGGAWSVLVDGLGSPSARPPFAVFTESINLDTSEGELHDAYIRLYRRAVSAATDGQRGDAPGEGETLVSYNLAMTKSTLALVPRVAEGGRVTDDKGDVVGSLALNGTVLAGTALVKSEAEWDALRGNKDELAAILSHIGIPVEKVRL